jgi:hypothetical protein
VPGVPERIRVVLEVWTAPHGRIDGCIEREDGDVLPFEGLLALMAALEDLLRPAEGSASLDAAPSDGSASPDATPTLG